MQQEEKNQEQNLQPEIPNQYLADRIAGRIDEHGNKIEQEESGSITSEETMESEDSDAEFVKSSETAETTDISNDATEESGSITSESEEELNKNLAEEKKGEGMYAEDEI